MEKQLLIAFGLLLFTGYISSQTEESMCILTFPFIILLGWLLKEGKYSSIMLSNTDLNSISNNTNLLISIMLIDNTN